MTEQMHTPTDATPGPWRVEEGTTLVWGACNSDDLSTRGMGYPITECRITPSASWAKGPSADEGEANARLIAAAPDLLEALKAQIEAHRLLCEAAGLDQQAHLDGTAQARAALSQQVQS